MVEVLTSFVGLLDGLTALPPPSSIEPADADVALLVGLVSDLVRIEVHLLGTLSEPPDTPSVTTLVAQFEKSPG